MNLNVNFFFLKKKETLEKHIMRLDITHTMYRCVYESIEHD